MCRILLVPPDQRGEGETEEEAVGGGNPAVAEPAASPTQEVRIEMIQVWTLNVLILSLESHLQ